MKRRGWTLSACLLLNSAWAAEPIITTYAGGENYVLGDGGPATSAQLKEPQSVAVDAAGNVYIAENGLAYACRVRKVTPNGIISTFAGTGSNGAVAENVPATSTTVCPTALAFDAAGNLYIGEAGRVRKVTPTGMISTVAGTGTSGYSGDGGSARNAQIGWVEDIAVDASGQVFFSDHLRRIRRVDTRGTIRTIAGNGEAVTTGDGGPATAAGMTPYGLVIDAAGNVIFADHDHLRRVSPAGTVTRFAGKGPFRVDPLAIHSNLYFPRGLAMGRNGELYIANEANLVHMVTPNGTLKVVAGAYNDSPFDPYGAWWGYDFDNVPATTALLNRPKDVAVAPDGTLYIADTRNNRVRKVTPTPLPALPAGVDAFHPPVTTVVGRYNGGMDIGDFNRDGRQDVVVVTESWLGDSADPETDYRLFVFLQQANGTLGAPSKLAFPATQYVGQFKAVDLNRDGYSDVVGGTTEGLSIYLGSATGLHAKTVLKGVSTATTPHSITTGDMNADGIPDIVAWMSSTYSGITIFYGDGQGGASRKVFLRQSIEAGRFAWGDVDRNGRADLLMTWADYGIDNGVAVFHHDGVDGFRAPTIFRAGKPWYPSAITTGDFDRDGMLDVVLANEENAPRAELVRMRLTSAHTLVPAASWKTYDAPKELIGRDINGDGLDDLLILHSGWNSVGYQQQKANATSGWLDPAIKYHVRNSGNAKLGALAAGDLNGDGCTDVAMIDYNYHLQVLHSKRCFRTKAPGRAVLPRFTLSGGLAPSALPSSAIPLDAAAAPGRTGVVATVTGGLHRATALFDRRVRNASAREIAGWSVLSLFLLVLAAKMPLLRRRG